MKTGRLSGVCLVVTMLTCAGCATDDPYTLKDRSDLLRGPIPVNADGTVNVVVEIPTGTNAKWEVEKASGILKWEFKKGKPRVVKYLGYPGNYGMIPRTLLSKEAGGDGDPLDVILLGSAVERGSVVSARLIGVMKMLDDGEQDDKLVAVATGSPFERIKSIDELHSKFNGVTEILEIWFSNYKGPGEIVTDGFAGPEAAREVLDAAIAAYAMDSSRNARRGTKVE